MPFKSLAQEHFLFAKHPEIAAKWANKTSNMKKLPEKVSQVSTPKPEKVSPWVKISMKGKL